jgi:hypothetical protein
MRLFRSVMPREERFIENFVAHSGQIVAAADALAALMAAGRNEQGDCFTRLSAIEKQADVITRQTVVALHRAFITPFDRSDILALINAMDDIVDLTEDVALHAALYRVEEFSPQMRHLGAMVQQAAQLIGELTPLLASVSANAEQINGLCERISRIESDADVVLRESLFALIGEKPDAIDFLGRKEVYELLEAVTDRCDDVADVIEGIVLDYV